MSGLWQQSYIYFKSRAERQIEMLKAELGYDSKIKSARIDYEYEARKRLYKEVEPIFLQRNSLPKAEEVCRRSPTESAMGTLLWIRE